MSHQRRRKLVLAVCAIVAAGAPTAAWAQEDGVFVDPGAPSAKEYALPLEAAREEVNSGSPTRRSKPSGERSAPLFGAGVTPDKGGPRSDAKIGKGDSAKSDAPTATQRSSATDPETRKLFAEAPAGGDGIMTMILGGIAALIVALATGLLMRGRHEGEAS